MESKIERCKERGSKNREKERAINGKQNREKKDERVKGY